MFCCGSRLCPKKNVSAKCIAAVAVVIRSIFQRGYIKEAKTLGGHKGDLKVTKICSI